MLVFNITGMHFLISIELFLTAFKSYTTQTADCEDIEENEICIYQEMNQVGIFRAQKLNLDRIIYSGFCFLFRKTYTNINLLSN